MVVVVQLLSHVQLSNPLDYSTPGFPVLHYLLKFAQTHVYWVSDANQPSHSLWPPSPPAINLSWHQGLLQWAARVLELQHPVDVQDWFPLGLTGLIIMLFKGLSRVFSSTTIWKHGLSLPAMVLLRVKNICEQRISLMHHLGASTDWKPSKTDPD